MADPGELARRLKAIRDAKARPLEGPRGPLVPQVSASASSAAPPPSSLRPDPDWVEAAPGVFRKTCRTPLDHPSLPPSLRDLWADSAKLGLLEEIRNCWYLDTETTGLSGGAGTHIFLTGWARLANTAMGESAALETTQYFMSDFPCEPEFVLAMQGEFTRDFSPGTDQIVTYNGASFDIPLIRNRWIMNGMFWPEYAHCDRLHEARRLWKGIHESCSLGNLEERLFGVKRQGDPGGAMVPVLYFQWLKHKDAVPFHQELSGVLEHHRQDLLSLCGVDLACRLVAAVGTPVLSGSDMPACRVQARADGASFVVAGPSWQVDVDSRGWYKNLQARAARSLKEGRADESTLAVQAARELCNRCWNQSPSLWWGRQQALVLQGEDRYRHNLDLWGTFHDPAELRACLVYLEHRAHNPFAALRLLESALSDPAPASASGLLTDPDLARRLQRLQNKVSKE